MRASEVTLPKLLKEAGYATAMAGKWHCNAVFNSEAQPQPDDAGFDHWFATQNNASPSHKDPVNFVRNGKPVGKIDGYSCQIVAEEGISWMEQQRDQPFFLFLTFHEPHEPIASPEELVAKYRDRAKSEEQAEYFANVENVDVAVGKVMSSLEKMGIAENTLVIFTSDNGPETHLRYAKSKRLLGSSRTSQGNETMDSRSGIPRAGHRELARENQARSSERYSCKFSRLPPNLLRARWKEDTRRAGFRWHRSFRTSFGSRLETGRATFLDLFQRDQ